MEIIWSEPALKRVAEIGDFIAKDSSSQAKRFIKELIQSVERLKEFPFSGPLVPESPAFRQTVFKGYRVIYRLQSDAIEIVTVISPGLSE
jgi:toxin ParE1/3/4